MSLKKQHGVSVSGTQTNPEPDIVCMENALYGAEGLNKELYKFLGYARKKGKSVVIASEIIKGTGDARDTDARELQKMLHGMIREGKCRPRDFTKELYGLGEIKAAEGPIFIGKNAPSHLPFQCSKYFYMDDPTFETLLKAGFRGWNQLLKPEVTDRHLSLILEPSRHER
ncbi:MAG: hypothetical protein DHS20C02_19860 [Micavibrio sp.]|nr:MAG: hypothetical protein DHS20C02_19860 [Micavibrio sp.]